MSVCLNQRTVLPHATPSPHTHEQRGSELLARLSRTSLVQHNEKVYQNEGADAEEMSSMQPGAHPSLQLWHGHYLNYCPQPSHVPSHYSTASLPIPIGPGAALITMVRFTADLVTVFAQRRGAAPRVGSARRGAAWPSSGAKPSSTLPNRQGIRQRRPPQLLIPWLP